MKTICLFHLELCRLLKSRFTYLIIVLSVLSPVIGLILYKPAAASTMLSIYIANPAIAGGMASGIMFGMLAVFELDRAARSRVDILIYAAVSPLCMALVRILTLMIAALITLGLAMLVWLPVSKLLIGSVFGFVDYVLAYPIFMGLAMPLGILSAAAAYQFTQRADLTMVLFAAFAALSLTLWADNWQLCWLNPCVWALSDDFSNFRIFRSVVYMRLTWLVALSGVWTISWLCLRQYGKGLLGSLLLSVRRIYRPTVALILLTFSVIAYAGQPMVDNSNPDETAMLFNEVPYTEDVVCTGYTAQIFPDVNAGTLSGYTAYQFQNGSGQEQRVAFGINPGYAVSNVKANGLDVPFLVSDYQEYNEAMLEITIPADKQVELTMEYGGFPRENANMSTMQGSTEISEEYMCLENATLSPRLMNVPPDENMYPAAIEITLPYSMTLIPFGNSDAQVVAEHENGTKTWRYKRNSTGGIVYAGNYIREEVVVDGFTIEFYYGSKHKAVMESAGAVNAIKSVVDYCVEHYGYLSFGDENKLKLIQSRVLGGGYAAGGASLLDEADFTAENLSNADKGSESGEVMIHELVHQWWGLGNMFDVSYPNSLWSAEGLTVYTTYRIVKELYGEDYAQKYYVAQWQKAVDDYYLDFYVRNPEYLAALPADKQLEITDNLTYVRQYCEMPLKILKAEALVGGEEAMDKILNGLFNRELDPMYPYLTYQEFLNACGLTEEDLNLA